jgi:hypothetical protein
MAKPVKGKGKPEAKGKAKPKGSNKLLILVTAMALVPFSLPTLMVMVCAMLPTLGAALAERGGSRYAWVCVGGMNFSGLAPWLFDLWFGHHTIDYAIHQITGVSMLLISYGAAGVGWMIYLAVPPVVATFTTMTSQRRSVVLIADQKKLLEIWGDGIAKSGMEL